MLAQSLAAKVKLISNRAHRLCKNNCYTTQAPSEKPNRIIRLSGTNPFWNLAFESYLLEQKRQKGQSGRWLMLWQNEPSIILGKHQNPWTECNIPYLRSKGIHLVRRASGGGTVYHDLGNSCVTIFTEKHEPERNLQYACDALREAFQVNAHIGPRKDIFVDEFKVSGSAFRITNKASYHHFTLLLSTDLSVLETTLKPQKMKLETKATPSVRSAVLNIGSRVPGIDHDAVCEALASKFSSIFYNENPGDISIEDWTYSQIQEIPEVVANYEEHIAWPFVYGKTPDFTQHFEEPLDSHRLKIAMSVKEGIIGSLQTELEPSDFVVETALENALVGHPYHGPTLTRTLLGQDAFLHDPDSHNLFRQIRIKLLESIAS
jgi:lipoate-protein ligase A